MINKKIRKIKWLKNMENYVLGFYMKNILFYIYFGIVKYTYTVKWFDNVLQEWIIPTSFF